MASSETDIVLPKSFHAFPEWVTIHSERSYRRAVEKLAYFFKREGGFDFPQFEADETDMTCTVYIWYDRAWIPSKKEVGYQMLGAACFRHGRRIGRKSESWFLVWVWIHPYFRNQGLLSRAWPIFLEKFGNDFIPEWPFTRSNEGVFTEKFDPRATRGNGRAWRFGRLPQKQLRVTRQTQNGC